MTPQPTTALLLESELTCPHCGHAKRETMPADACLFLYACERCKSRLRAKLGRLLRVLLVRLGALSTGPGAAGLLRLTSACMQVPQPLRTAT